QRPDLFCKGGPVLRHLGPIETRRDQPPEASQRIEEKDTIPGDGPQISTGIRLHADNGIVVRIDPFVGPVIEIVKSAGMAIIETEPSLGAHGQEVAWQPFEAINKIMR